MKTKLTLFFILLLISNYSFCQYDNYGNGKNNILLKNASKANLSDSITNVIPSGLSATNGITFDNNNLWVASIDSTLYKISSIDGSLQKTLDVNIEYITGITFIEPNLYVVDKNNKRICKVDTTNGNIIDFFDTPEYNIDGFSAGLTWDGNNLWYNCGGAVDSTYELSLSGQVLSNYKAFGGTPTGLAYDGNNLWSISTSLDLIYKISIQDFTLIDSVNAPGGNGPNGLAFDGQYLWISNNETDSIYQLDIGIPTNIISNKIVPEIINVWPNPCVDFFNIEIPNRAYDIKLFQISDMKGQIIKEVSIQDNNLSNIFKLDVGGIKPGVYIINTKMNNKTIGKTVIIK